MNKGKKVLIICSICILAFVIITICIGFLINSIIPKTYSSAKIDCEKVLNKYQVQMEEIAVDSLKSVKNIAGEFKEYYYSCYKADGVVTFDIDEQGFMLGGQYWELVYTQDGTFCGETESYLYKETYGNNIVKAEKISEHWWYLWTDYDGTESSYH